MMATHTNNIEPIARAICEQSLRRFSKSDAELAADVECYRHCVAAQIEAGYIDDAGRSVPHDFEAGVDAYNDWRHRHPEFKPVRR